MTGRYWPVTGDVETMVPDPARWSGFERCYVRAEEEGGGGPTPRDNLS